MSINKFRNNLPKIDLIESAAKTPEAMAIAILRYSSIFYRKNRPSLLSAKQVMKLHRKDLHSTLFEHADIEADVIYPDIRLPNLRALWHSPEAITSLREVATMNAVELSKLAQYCRSVLPALNTAILCDLNGEKTTNLVSILGEWSNAALQTLENDTYHTDEICNLLETVFSDTFIDGVTSIEDIDNRISDAAEMIGITNPAAIETLLLRGTGILDAETYHLGKDPANEYAAGVSYALVLAHFAHKAGLTSKKVSLQDAYVKTRVGELHGHSAAIKSGAAKCGEVIEVGLPEFTSHSPDVSRYVAEALLQVMHTKSDFDALIATIDILSGNNLSLDISHDAALVVAERAYVKETLHDERTVREVLSCNMVIGCPDYFDHEICPNMNPQAVQNIAKRLNNSFLQAFPNAKPITPETHHAEVVKRLNSSRSA